jgi:hypothetical protein
MDPSDAPTLAGNDPGGAIRELSALFGSYKAEWLNERVIQLFTEPTYFSELLGARPCVLIGGRGTGKTTVLRGLAYEGQFGLAKDDIDAFVQSDYVGVYYRVDTNRVSALQGPELEDWTAVFAHYFNLLICTELARFLRWFSRVTGRPVEIPAEAHVLLGGAFRMTPADSIADLESRLTLARVTFENYVNNVADEVTPNLSAQGAPIGIMAEAIRGVPGLEHKRVDILIDEYENFQDYQQQVVNTLIKHSGQGITFKVGVRELGWRVRTTLNENEQLVSPSDYDRVDVNSTLTGETFKRFAASVCKSRFAMLAGYRETGFEVREMLPGLSEDEEAARLGAEERVADFAGSLDDKLRKQFRTLSLSRQLVLTEWSRNNSSEPSELMAAVARNPKEWERRFGNYKHATLYTLRRGKRGIRKYYAGWDVFTQLASGNIRYLLELVEEALVEHVRQGGSLGEPVKPELQTRAAQAVASKNLSELEGLAVNGAKLAKLVLSLGRVFQTMAMEPFGHAPEVNQFRLGDRGGPRDVDVDRLLGTAVMHLALVRMPGNKLADSQTREYDYALHPMFAALFVFSHRKKRKMVISAADLMGLVEEPPTYIRRVLASSGRVLPDDMPEQLALFRDFYTHDADR